MKYCLILFFVNLFFSVEAQKASKYSIADEVLLKNADKKFNRLSDISHNETYQLGKQYEKIYDIYKDTSMKRAVKCFESFCDSENDVYYYTSLQKLTAYNLGEIYERGKGIPKDTLMSITWYRISNKAGLKKSTVLQDLFCKKDLLFYLDNWMVLTDSIMIRNFLQNGTSITIPFIHSCKYTTAQVAAVAKPICRALLDNPRLQVEISFNVSSKWNFTHNRDIQNQSRNTFQQLQTYMIEREGISPNRIYDKDVNIYSAYSNFQTGVSTIEISVQDSDNFFNKNESIVLEGLYLNKENSHCSRSIRFEKNGIYYFEGGCEDRSSISFGSYRATKDEIRLTPSPNTEPLFTMNLSDTVGGNWLNIVDYSGKPISSFELLTIGDQPIDTLQDSYTNRPDSFGYYKISLWERAFTFKRWIRDIEVSPVFKKWYPLNNVVNKIVTLKFNYPDFLLTYPYITEAVGYPTRYFIKSKKDFVDSSGMSFSKQKGF